MKSHSEQLDKVLDKYKNTKGVQTGLPLNTPQTDKSNDTPKYIPIPLPIPSQKK